MRRPGAARQQFVGATGGLSDGADRSLGGGGVCDTGGGKAGRSVANGMTGVAPGDFERGRVEYVVGRCTSGVRSRRLAIARCAAKARGTGADAPCRTAGGA
ncbi:MAG TPA: hypothetical protein VJO52_06625, partial [Gemmatimonadaceae bacterium]|nr:hypothetical protein [Gemmatimonadaceae bacterium]